jgi:hypothetical protein
MKLRDKKRRMRQLSDERWQLVHAAGCTHTHCISRLVYSEPDDDVVVSHGVRIPRSLRALLEHRRGDAWEEGSRLGPLPP